MHVLFLPALLCCFFLDIVSMDTGNTSLINTKGGITPVPQDFASSAFSDDCVGSMQGCMFNENPRNPVVLLSTLMLLHQDEPSQKSESQLQSIQNLLQENVQVKKLSSSRKIHTSLKDAFTTIYKALWSQKKEEKLDDEDIHTQLMRYACAGYIRILTPKGSYITYLKESNHFPFKLNHTSRAYPEPLNYFTYFSKTGALGPETQKILLERFQDKNDTLNETLKSILGCLKNSKSIATIIDVDQLGSQFQETDKEPSSCYLCCLCCIYGNTMPEIEYMDIVKEY